jgi:uncharacterized membrane protein YoaK (UPF0700 family)
MKQPEQQMSESLLLGAVLAMAGGFMDAYSYMCRGHVFANAQTGNILLLGVHLSQGEWQDAAHYLFPVLSFVIGLALSDFVRLTRKGSERLHWRQTTTAVEALVLFGVSFLPQAYNLPANCLTSLACGIQVESFRKICGTGVATTMCIGNLRSATQNICEFLRTKDRKNLELGGVYFFIIFCFTIGAILGNLAVGWMAEGALRLSAALLVIAFVMMFVPPKKLA